MTRTVLRSLSTTFLMAGLGALAATCGDGGGEFWDGGSDVDPVCREQRNPSRGHARRDRDVT